MCDIYMLFLVLIIFLANLAFVFSCQRLMEI